MATCHNPSSLPPGMFIHSARPSTSWIHDQATEQGVRNFDAFSRFASTRFSNAQVHLINDARHGRARRVAWRHVGIDNLCSARPERIRLQLHQLEKCGAAGQYFHIPECSFNRMANPQFHSVAQGQPAIPHDCRYLLRFFHLGHGIRQAFIRIRKTAGEDC